uniref:Uncharacterized protein n=1 Tax=Anguilla anguilla TaxID=7936 RepID=A0A0E9R1H0_ANGAN
MVTINHVHFLYCLELRFKVIYIVYCHVHFYFCIAFIIPMMFWVYLSQVK